MPEEKRDNKACQSSAVLIRALSFFLFRLNFSPNTSLNIPSLHNMLSPIVKTNVNGVSRDVCEFFQATKLNKGFHCARNHHGDH